MDKTTRDFLIGACFGYLLRHLLPPEQHSLKFKILVGIGVIVYLILYVLRWFRYRKKEIKRKNKEL